MRWLSQMKELRHKIKWTTWCHTRSTTAVTRTSITWFRRPRPQTLGCPTFQYSLERTKRKIIPLPWKKMTSSVGEEDCMDWGSQELGAIKNPKGKEKVPIRTVAGSGWCYSLSALFLSWHPTKVLLLIYLLLQKKKILKPNIIYRKKKMSTF